MTMVPQVTRLISQGADNTVAMSFESLRQSYDDLASLMAMAMHHRDYDVHGDHGQNCCNVV